MSLSASNTISLSNSFACSIAPRITPRKHVESGKLSHGPVGVKAALYYKDEFKIYDPKASTTVVLLNPQYPAWLGGASKSRAVLRSMVKSEAPNSTHRIPADVTLTLSQANEPETIALISRLLETCELNADVRIFSANFPRSLRSWGEKLQAQLFRLQSKFDTGDSKWKVVLEGPSDDVGSDAPQRINFTFLHPDLHIPVDATYDFFTDDLIVLDMESVNLHRMPPFLDVVVAAFGAAREASGDRIVRQSGFLVALRQAGIEANATFADALLPLLQKHNEPGMLRNMAHGMLFNALRDQRLIWAQTGVNQYTANLTSAA